MAFEVGERVRLTEEKPERFNVERGEVGRVVKLPECYAYPYQVVFEGRPSLNCWPRELEPVEDDDE